MLLRWWSYRVKIECDIVLLTPMVVRPKMAVVFVTYIRTSDTLPKLKDGPLCCEFYRAFHRFGQAKIAHSGLVLGSSQFLLLPQLPQKKMRASKVVKIDLKIIILLR